MSAMAIATFAKCSLGSNSAMSTQGRQIRLLCVSPSTDTPMAVADRLLSHQRTPVAGNSKSPTTRNGRLVRNPRGTQRLPEPMRQVRPSRAGRQPVATGAVLGSIFRGNLPRHRQARSGPTIGISLPLPQVLQVRIHWVLVVTRRSSPSGKRKSWQWLLDGYRTPQGQCLPT